MPCREDHPTPVVLVNRPDRMLSRSGATNQNLINVFDKREAEAERSSDYVEHRKRLLKTNVFDKREAEAERSSDYVEHRKRLLKTNVFDKREAEAERSSDYAGRRKRLPRTF